MTSRTLLPCPLWLLLPRRPGKKGTARFASLGSGTPTCLTDPTNCKPLTSESFVSLSEAEAGRELSAQMFPSWSPNSL